MEYVTGNDAGKKLVEKGLLLPQTIDFKLVFDLERPIRLISESYLTSQEYAEFLGILQAYPGRRQAFRTDVLAPPE